jgi:hypothetical protein
VKPAEMVVVFQVAEQAKVALKPSRDAAFVVLKQIKRIRCAAHSLKMENVAGVAINAVPKKNRFAWPMALARIVMTNVFLGSEHHLN